MMISLDAIYIYINRLKRIKCDFANNCIANFLKDKDCKYMLIGFM